MRLPGWRYEEIKETVSQILACYSTGSIPLDVETLAANLGMRVVPYSALTKDELRRIAEIVPNIMRNGVMKDGIFFDAQKCGLNAQYIYYNDGFAENRIRFTLCHEIGHFVLRHTQTSELAESEANFFARYALAAPELVALINPEDYIDVARAFKISRACASGAFVQYKKWRHCCGGRLASGLYMPYERTMLAAFSESIMQWKVRLAV